jgi:signal transduction histidine kinase
LARRRWLHLPGRTVRVRLTALYGGLFLVSGAALLAITYALVAGQRITTAFRISGAVKGNFKLVPAGPQAQILVRPGLPASAAATLRRLLERLGGGNVTSQSVSGSAKSLPSVPSLPSATSVTNVTNVTSATSATSVSSVSGATGAAAHGITSQSAQAVHSQFVSFQATLPTPVELHTLLVLSIIALAIMAVVSIGLGWVVAGRVLSPIRVMTSNARHISAENLHERLGVQGPQAELKDLGDTIDELLGRLETAFEAQKRFVANASHELRTPLTMMRTSVDVAIGKPQPPAEVRVLASKVGEGLDESDRILEGLLLLARAQRGALGDMTAVSLPDLVENAVAAEQAEITAKQLVVEEQLLPATVMGNEVLLALMVANVIDNAVRHNVAGGLVHISNDFDGVVARLVVENGGEVIDESEVGLLGEPFHRIGAERLASGHGAGLGLSIVSAIAAAHGGALRLAARPEGGLRVVIELPVAGHV